jgi:CheY-like chemotaxis protein
VGAEFTGMKNQSEISGRVLVVDDDQSTRILHRTALSVQFDVETAGSGREAVQICKARIPDLVLLDVMMPEMDGYETCRLIREFTDIPIIFATANDTLAEHLKAFDAGGDDIITKPLVREILLRKVSLAIQHKHEKSSLAREKDTLQSMAMNFLSAVGESGVLQQFMQASLTCSTPDELGRHLVTAISNFGLDCSVLIRNENSPAVLTSHKEANEIERAILEQAATMGRIFQFKQKLVVNYDQVSVIVNNMPMDESEKTGRLRDNITMLAEMTDTLCSNVTMRQTSHSRAEQMQVAMTTGFFTIKSLRELTGNTQADTRLLLQELVDHVEKTYTWLGTSRDQEEKISKAMYGSIEKILLLLETAGTQSNEKFDQLMLAMRPDQDSGDADLF